MSQVLGRNVQRKMKNVTRNYLAGDYVFEQDGTMRRMTPVESAIAHGSSQTSVVGQTTHSYGKLIY